MVLQLGMHKLVLVEKSLLDGIEFVMGYCLIRRCYPLLFPVVRIRIGRWNQICRVDLSMLDPWEDLILMDIDSVALVLDYLLLEEV